MGNEWTTFARKFRFKSGKIDMKRASVAWRKLKKGKASGKSAKRANVKRPAKPRRGSGAPPVLAAKRSSVKRPAKASSSGGLYRFERSGKYSYIDKCGKKYVGVPRRKGQFASISKGAIPLTFQGAGKGWRNNPGRKRGRLRRSFRVYRFR